MSADDLVKKRCGCPPAGSAVTRTVLGQFFAWATWKGYRTVDPIASAPRHIRKSDQAQQERAAQPPQWRDVDLIVRTVSICAEGDRSQHPRHSARGGALLAGEPGYDLEQISKRLGDANLAQTATYVHASPAALAETQAQYDVFLADLAAKARAAAAAAGTNPGSSVDKQGTNGRHPKAGPPGRG